MELYKNFFSHPPSSTVFLERIMSLGLEEYDGKVSTGGRSITNLRFAGDINAVAEAQQELETLVESPNKTCESITRR